jgi:GNAT superfamily N-acetyltransferase
MYIQKVENKAELKKFVELPYRLYKNDPIWVPPLRSEQWKQYDLKSNPMLEHCTYQLFLAVEGEQVIGRVSAFTDRLALEHWGEPIGLFGSYECINDQSVSQALLEAAREWLKERGMKAMRGPWSFASQEWGLVVEGFTPAPVIMAPYNPPFYNEHLTAFGFEKGKDLIVYVIDENEGYQIPERILTLTDKIQKRYGVSVRPIDMKNLEKEVVTIVQMANRSISDNWGFYPVTDTEGRAMAHDLKDIVNPKGILLAEDEQCKPIGFIMALPDINTLLRGLNGRLFPRGWLKLLLGLPRLQQYRLWALGVIPEYHGRGIDTLMYRKAYELLHNGKIRMEINYVLEDNEPMNNVLLKMGVKNLRRYRVYEMEI